MYFFNGDIVYMMMGFIFKSGVGVYWNMGVYYNKYGI